MSADASASATSVRRATDGVARQEPVLVLRNVCKSFGGVPALRNVDLDVRPGEVHALVGQNGSGKSTLIKILSGFHAADEEHQATLNGTPFALDGHPVPGVRFVHQDLGLIDILSAVDNFALGSEYVTDRVGRIRWRRQLARARAAIEAIGYDVDVTVPVGQLAPIERTAIAIARALQDLGDGTSVLVMDEPTATMPRREVDHLLQIIQRLKSRGLGIIYVSHHLTEIFEVADRITVLRDGNKIACADVADVAPSSVIELMTGGMVDVARIERAVTSEAVGLSVTGLHAGTIQNLSFEVRCGEVLGIAGISGSGRGEVCAALFGAARRGGDVAVGGALLPPLDPARAVELGVGYVPADRTHSGLIMSFSVSENLTLPGLDRLARFMRLRARTEGSAVTAALREFGVKTPSADAPVGALSGGNQQKVVLGKWLRMRPQVLLLDEPTQGVDVAAKADMHALVDRAAATGAAVLVCSSDEEELERLCDRVLVLRGGVVTAELAGSDISAHRLADESQVSAPVRDDTPRSVAPAESLS